MQITTCISNAIANTS